MARRLVVGVDSSTQSTKVEARDIATGQVIATGSSPHPVTEPPVSEQDPLAWWAALVDACGQLGSCRDEAVAVSVAGQQHGCVLLGADGAPLRPAKLWNDTTSAVEAASLVDRFGAETLAHLTGSVPVAAFTISKLAWLAEHEADTLVRTHKVMLPHDYLTWTMTGEHVTDRGDASGTGWFNPSSGECVEEVLAAAVRDDTGSWMERVPRVLGPTEAAGELQRDAAEQLGLPVGITVGPGTGDNMGAALGLGLAAGDVVMSLGTSGTAFAVSNDATHDPSGAVAGFADATGRFLPLVCTLNATKVTDTVAGWLGTDASGLAELALRAVGDSGSALLVPYFDGERTPNLPSATGLFAGLTNSTTREQLSLAAHDGVLCGLLNGVDALRAVGATIDGRVFLVGGGSRSAAYRQRAADLLGQTVVVPETDETVATGAAVQAAVVSSGRSWDDIASAWHLGRGAAVEPRSDASEVRIRYQTLANAVTDG